MRQAYFVAYYNGKSMMASLTGCTTSFSFTEEADGEGDDASITIADPTRAWLTAYFPSKGDTLSAEIVCSDWDGGNGVMPCGTFVIDDIAFSGEPTVLKISALSTPENEEFRTRERSQTWEQVTLEEIAREIAARAGVALYYDADKIKISALEQSDKTDCAFLTELCKTYGLSMKVYNNRLVIFDRVKRKERSPSFFFSPADVLSWSFDTSLLGSYTGGEIGYTDPQTGEDITYSIGGKGRWLKINEKADNITDAEKKLKAALDEANHDETTLELSMPGKPRVFPAMTAQFSGLGGHVDGKYYINSVSHDVSSSGYTSKISLSKVVVL